MCTPIRAALRQGRFAKDVDFSVDDKILAALGKPIPHTPKAAASKASSNGASSYSSNGSASGSDSPRRSSFSPRRDLKVRKAE